MDNRHAAAYLLRAWWADAPIINVVAALKVTLQELRDNPSLYPMLPRDRFAYYRWSTGGIKSGKQRGTKDVVAHIYPKLSEWLFKRTRLEDCLPALDQVSRLVASDYGRQIMHKLDADDKRDYYVTRKARNTESLIKSIEDTHKRSAWGTIKATGRNRRA